ncbi:YopT-type cysteine protease domain-containing protein [Xanthomonas vasicola pv. vasculorum]|uniref:YopT-type cysteine protease domain-containing protein n=1 Tax=Xanthomonas vasicola TaxID=56459 RepID=UPI001F33ED58|nr:YopT-type cysteine protease domain-containing protein [Xanthomonas vasicola]MDO6956184.1 YopT-type cysteine protease domain-containing protein [Xanthomonas vasicola]
MAKTRLAFPVATAASIPSHTQAPPISELWPEAPATSCGPLAGLPRRPARAHRSTSLLSASRSGLDLPSCEAQAGQPTETVATSVGCADVPTRLKAKLSGLACWAPSDKSVFEKSLRFGFVQDRKSLETVFNGDEIGGGGLCAGLSAIWMNLHCAVPDAKVSTRLQTLASPESLHHALIYQRLYCLHYEDSLNLRYSTQGSFEPKSIQSEAFRKISENPLHPILSVESEGREHMNELYGIAREDMPIKSTSSSAEMAEAIATIDGYASLLYQRIHNEKKQRSAHEMSMYRNAQNGMITFFEPNFGEFRFSTKAAAQFLREIKKRVRDRSDIYFNWILTRVRPNIAGTSTPIDVLVDHIKAKYAARLMP